MFYLNVEINKGHLVANANLESLGCTLIQIDDFGVMIFKKKSTLSDLSHGSVQISVVS